MSTWLVALVLLPIAVLLVAGLVLLLARPLVVPALAALERARFQRCLARAAHGDARLQERQIEAALREFEAAFCLIIVLADDLPPQRVRLLALAKVERLLARRSEMQRAHLQLRNRPLRDARRLQLER